MIDSTLAVFMQSDMFMDTVCWTCTHWCDSFNANGLMVCFYRRDVK